MRVFFFSIAILGSVIFTSCKKDYVCVCTNSNTGVKVMVTILKRMQLLKKQRRSPVKPTTIYRPGA